MNLKDPPSACTESPRSRLPPTGSTTCPNLANKQKLEKETSECIKRKQIPTKVSKSLKTQQGECTILKHSVIRRPGQICISQKPVTQCAIGCQPAHPEALNKKIPFTCPKEDRVAEHYAKKADRGHKMVELT